MASAPPMDNSVPLGFAAAPPSYDETMNPGSQGYQHGNITVPPPVYGKGAPTPYPPQNYTQMYSPPQPVPSMSGPPPVVSVQTVYVQPTVFGSNPVQSVCPMCTQTVITRVVHTSGAMTWLSCTGLFIFGCFYGCCLIPFCVDSLKDVTHYCPNCNNVMGEFKRL